MINQVRWIALLSALTLLPVSRAYEPGFEPLFDNKTLNAGNSSVDTALAMSLKTARSSVRQMEAGICSPKKNTVTLCFGSNFC
ncbi:MAG: hypothetical protein M3Y27_13045 [Acidobacteriota bacterium]|nr:hypothetical protein [Acidobacteriota bacterium]